MTVCVTCLERLLDRQAYDDQVENDQTAFDRQLAEQRLFYQAEALRLNEARLQLTARLQEAKLGTGKRTKIQWVIHIIGWTVGKTFEGVHYVFRHTLR